MTAAFILLLIGAYFLGSIPTAYLIARWRRGIDIRTHGSGNVGASNVLSAVSKRWSLFVTVVDISKGVIPVLIAQQLGLGAAQQAVAGIAAISGHNWTVFLHFQGGRGVFTTLGVIVMLNPWLGLIALVFPYLLAPIRQVSLGVFLVLIILPLTAWFAGDALGVDEPLATALGCVVIMMVLMFRRITVARSPISENVPLGELLLNRFLFDRDIRDRKTWINHTRSPETPEAGQD